MTVFVDGQDVAALPHLENACVNQELITNGCQKLEECETVIERGLQTFVEVGKALSEIRDFRLYRFEYGTFETYLNRRWDLSRSRAYQMIKASRVTRDMSTIVDAELPATESQARELVGLDTEQAALVMRETANRVHGKVTAKKIRETRERLLNPQPKSAPPKPQAPSVINPSDDPHYYCDDETWWTREALTAWDDYPDVFALRQAFRDLLDRHIDCCDPNDMAWQWASLLDYQRQAPGSIVLAALTSEIGRKINPPSPADVLPEIVKSLEAVVVACHFPQLDAVEKPVVVQHVAAIRDALDGIYGLIEQWAV